MGPGQGDRTDETRSKEGQGTHPVLDGGRETKLEDAYPNRTQRIETGFRTREQIPGRQEAQQRPG